MARRTKKSVPRDPYWEVVQSLMQDITYCYEQYREKKPALLFDMQENRIYVYPYLEFKNDLSERSQRLLQDQYERAMMDDKIVVFVQDNDAQETRVVFRVKRTREGPCSTREGHYGMDYLCVGFIYYTY